MKNDASLKKNNFGFTLVEILVVTIIIAILSVVIIPTFIDYLRDDYDDEVTEQTKALLNASQIVFYEMYAEDQDNGDYRCVIAGSETDDSSNYHFYGVNNKKLDCDIRKNAAVTNRVYDLSEVDLNTNTYGNLLLVCLGRADIYLDPCSEYYDPAKAYTVYMIAFQPVANKKITFLTADATEPIYKSPLQTHPGQKNYTLTVNGVEKKADYLIIDNEKVFIQYYALKIGYNNNITFDGDKVWKNIVYKEYN